MKQRHMQLAMKHVQWAVHDSEQDRDKALFIMKAMWRRDVALNLYHVIKSLWKYSFTCVQL